MHKVSPKKYLGQHFLKDKGLAQRIVDLLEADREDPVVEIGPGRGILTQYLLDLYPNLWLIEVDPEAADFIRRKFEDKNPRLYLKDILKWNMREEIPPNTSFIGNLPYNISSPIFFRLLDHLPYVKEGVFMIQKEVADRICSPHGNKTYGILSVLLGAYFDISYAFSVSPGVFVPPPKVQSAVIVLQRKEEIPEVPFADLKRVVKAAFNQRRKTLKNALKGLEFHPFEEGTDKMSLRAEQLSVEEFVHMSKYLKTVKSERNSLG
ncbi:MAG: 16S rRNA (adenine(1518)-N(6)/adenine(1519)-N(6))-dimethyltransferase RsmA [Bacteroidota bacterium]